MPQSYSRDLDPCDHYTVTPNPDIGGVGIISAAFTQAGIALVIGWALYFLTGRSRRDAIVIKTVLLRIWSEIYEKVRPWAGVPEALMSALGEIFRSVPNPELYIQEDRRKKHIFMIQMLQYIIASSSDMHTFAGVALLLAANIQLHDMEWYHREIVHQIGWLPSQSHELFLAYACTNAEGSGRYQLLGRLAGIMAFFLIWLTYEIRYLELVIESEYSGEYCASRGEKSWPWIVVNVILVSWSYVPFMRDFANNLWAKTDSQNESSQDVEAHRERKPAWLGHGLRFIRRLFSVLSTKLVVLVVILVWYLWQIRDTAVLRNVTKPHFVNGDEDTWGFGQIVAVASLLQLVLVFATSYEYYQQMLAQDDTATIPPSQFIKGEKLARFDIPPPEVRVESQAVSA